MSSRRGERVALPAQVQAQLAQIEAEYSSGELTQRGYELRRSRILSPIDIAGLNHVIDANRTVSAVSPLRKEL